MKTYCLLISGILLGFPSFSQSASFDCEKASTYVEKSICADKNLSLLDDQLTAAYKKATQNVRVRKSLQAQQRAWLQLVRDRDLKAFNLERIYSARLQHLSSKNPLLSALEGTFSCEINSTKDDDNEYYKKNLSFKIRDGKIVEFSWTATQAPKSPDLRPGYHYSTTVALSQLKIVQAPGFLALQSQPVTDRHNEVQEYCDIIIVKHNSDLNVYTIGCSSQPDTSHFSFTFFQSGSTCNLI